MNAQEQKRRCPVRIGDAYMGGRVVYILGDSRGWDIWIRRTGFRGLSAETRIRVTA